MRLSITESNPTKKALENPRVLLNKKMRAFAIWEQKADGKFVVWIDDGNITMRIQHRFNSKKEALSVAKKVEKKTQDGQNSCEV